MIKIKNFESKGLQVSIDTNLIMGNGDVFKRGSLKPMEMVNGIVSGWVRVNMAAGW